jgi:hypothetical protein
MITHSGLRHEDILNIRHPATLPRKHMFTLLLDLIGEFLLHILFLFAFSRVLASGLAKNAGLTFGFDYKFLRVGALCYSLAREISGWYLPCLNSLSKTKLGLLPV